MQSCLCSDISAVTVSYEGRSLSPSSISLCEEQETLTLSLTEQLRPGTRALVHYTFTGVLNDKLTGFYRSQYTVNGESRRV